MGLAFAWGGNFAGIRVKDRSRLSPLTWIFGAWVPFVVSFFLPAFQPDGGVIPGFRCAQYAVEAWYPSALWDAMRTPGSSDSAMVLMLGWFNLSNAAALLIPLVAGSVRLRPALGWLVFLCGFGFAHSLAFVAGIWTQEPLWPRLHAGYYLWTMGYAALAIAGWNGWRRMRLTNV